MAAAGEGRELYAVIADDLTGAGDTGVQFARAGLRTRALLGKWSDEAAAATDVVVISTDSRALAPEAAYDAVADAASRLRGVGARPVYKKIDSTMRGPVGAEIDAVMDVFGLSLAVVCPAFPENGRVVVGGCLLVSGEPVARTPIARDPVAPVRDSWLPALLAAQTRRPVHHVGVDVLDEGENVLAERLAELGRGEAVVVVDALRGADLETIVKATKALRERVLLVGSAGLAQPLARELATDRPAAREAAGVRGVLVIVGSVNPVSRGQIAALTRHERVRVVTLDAKALLAEGVDGQSVDRVRSVVREAASVGGVVVLTTAGEAADVEETQRFGAERGLGPQEVALRVAAGLGALAAEVLADNELAGVVATGGDTARALLGALGADGVDLVAEVAPGIPFGRLHGGRQPGLAIVTKAGGFGGSDALVQAAAFVAEHA